MKQEFRLPKRKNRVFRMVSCGGLVVAIAAGMLFYYDGSASNTEPEVAVGSKPEVAGAVNTPTLATSIAWPEYGQAAYGTIQYGSIETSAKDDKPVPIASLAKIITAQAILQKKPLAPGELGPKITITKDDEALYNKYLAKDGSVTLVKAGQKIHQYHAMQAMLMSSSNNVTDTLAIWAFGSMDAYTSYANAMVAEMGLTNTTVSDASGFSPKTVSTSEEMVAVSVAFLKQPVLKEIVTGDDANVPGLGAVTNYNSAFNTKDIIGVKAGYTDEANRCFISASVKDGEVYAISVVLGADDIRTAIKDTQTILIKGNASFENGSAGRTITTQGDRRDDS